MWHFKVFQFFPLNRLFQFFKNSLKWTAFGIFNSLLSTQDVNLARFARSAE